LKSRTTERNNIKRIRYLRIYTVKDYPSKAIILLILSLLKILRKPISD